MVEAMAAIGIDRGLVVKVSTDVDFVESYLDEVELVSLVTVVGI